MLQKPHVNQGQVHDFSPIKDSRFFIVVIMCLKMNKNNFKDLQRERSAGGKGFFSASKYNCDYLLNICGRFSTVLHW